MSETYPPNYTSEGSLIGSGGLITSPSSTSSLTLPKSEIKEVDKPLAGKKVLVVEGGEVQGRSIPFEGPGAKEENGPYFFYFTKFDKI